jgi:hypothetical protein
MWELDALGLPIFRYPLRVYFFAHAVRFDPGLTQISTGRYNRVARGVSDDDRWRHETAA